MSNLLVSFKWSEEGSTHNLLIGNIVFGSVVEGMNVHYHAYLNKSGLIFHRGGYPTLEDAKKSLECVVRGELSDEIPEIENANG